MPEVIEKVKIGIKDTTNEASTRDPWVPRHMRKAIYITKIDESPHQLNEVECFTRTENLSRQNIIFSITSDPIEEFDLAPELNLSDAARIAKKFINDLPDDIIDADLGSGL